MKTLRNKIPARVAVVLYYSAGNLFFLSDLIPELGFFAQKCAIATRAGIILDDASRFGIQMCPKWDFNSPFGIILRGNLLIISDFHSPITNTFKNKTSKRARATLNLEGGERVGRSRVVRMSYPCSNLPGRPNWDFYRR